MKNICLQIALSGERLYKLYLDVIKSELDELKISDITSFQAVILINLGKNTLSVGELISRGHYAGSNTSYNLRKLIDNGYVIQTTSQSDKRSSDIKLSDRGVKLYEKLIAITNEHIEKLEIITEGEMSIEEIAKSLTKLEGHLTEMLRAQF